MKMISNSIGFNWGVSSTNQPKSTTEKPTDFGVEIRHLMTTASQHPRLAPSRAPPVRTRSEAPLHDAARHGALGAAEALLLDVIATAMGRWPPEAARRWTPKNRWAAQIFRKRSMRSQATSFKDPKMPLSHQVARRLRGG